MPWTEVRRWAGDSRRWTAASLITSVTRVSHLRLRRLSSVWHGGIRHSFAVLRRQTLLCRGSVT